MYIKDTKVYDFFKYLGRYVLPALATLYIALADLWGLPFKTEISGTLMAVDTFLNVVLGISNENFKQMEADEVIRKSTTEDYDTGTGGEE